MATAVGPGAVDGIVNAPANLVVRYVGDDWVLGPIALTAAGTAIDLTGAEVSALFYARDHLDPVVTLIEPETSGPGGLAVATDRTTGIITEVWIAAAVTAGVKPDDQRDPSYPTRLAIVVTDSRGRERTFLLVLFRALDRRSDALGTSPQACMWPGSRGDAPT